MDKQEKYKNEKYKRGRNLLLDDFYELLKVQNISPNFKFHNLRDDFLHAWTSPNGERKNSKKYWSKKAFDLFKPRYDDGITNEKILFKGIQLDHIVPRVWFEEMIMPLINKNRDKVGFEIPRYALEFLFERLAIGALVTEDENQREIDSIKIIRTVKKRKGIHKGKVIKEEKWKNRPNIYKLPLNFYNPSHEYFLNPWARYMEAKIEVIIVNNSNNKIKTNKLDFENYKFDINNLTDSEQKGFEYWSDVLENIYENSLMNESNN